MRKEFSTGRLEGWYWQHDANEACGALYDLNDKMHFVYDLEPFHREGWIEFKAHENSKWEIFYDNDIERFQRYAENRILEEGLS